MDANTICGVITVLLLVFSIAATCYRIGFNIAARKERLDLLEWLQDMSDSGEEDYDPDLDTADFDQGWISGIKSVIEYING